MKKICACGCGKEFELSPSRPIRIYFNPLCRRRAYQRVHREEREPYKKAWNEANKEKRRSYMRAYAEATRERRHSLQRQRRHEGRDYIRSVLSNRGCLVCGIQDIWALDLHHRNSNWKDSYPHIGSLQGHSRKRIDEEIAKCDVLCANCHRRMHYELEQEKEVLK